MSDDTTTKQAHIVELARLPGDLEGFDATAGPVFMLHGMLGAQPGAYAGWLFVPLPNQTTEQVATYTAQLAAAGVITTTTPDNKG